MQQVPNYKNEVYGLHSYIRYLISLIFRYYVQILRASKYVHSMTVIKTNIFPSKKTIYLPKLSLNILWNNALVLLQPLTNTCFHSKLEIRKKINSLHMQNYYNRQDNTQVLLTTTTQLLKNYRYRPSDGQRLFYNTFVTRNERRAHAHFVTRNETCEKRNTQREMTISHLFRHTLNVSALVKRNVQACVVAQQLDPSVQTGDSV